MTFSWGGLLRSSLIYRCIIQLTLLGYILVPIFTYNQWWLVLLYASFMLYVGCLEASQRPAYSYTVGASSISLIGMSTLKLLAAIYVHESIS